MLPGLAGKRLLSCWRPCPYGILIREVIGDQRLASEPLPVFRSSGVNGFSTAITGSPRTIRARKLEHEVQVRFTRIPCSIQTNEGTVHAREGDAILTGIAGEHWRVSHTRFPHKYRPVPPTEAGEAGRYVSLPNEVLALPMERPFIVVLADQTSRLSGKTGDYLVDYGDGSLGIVAPSVFATTYEIIDATQ
jgi:hypothetical protein